MPHKKLFSVKAILWFVILLTIGLIVTKTVSTDIPLETGILGTMYTFFYGLFINSLFKFLDEKYVNFRVYLGDLIGRVQAVYNLAVLTGNEKFKNRMKKELIDFTESFNKLKATHYYLNQHHINRLYDTTKELKVKTDKQKTEYSRILSSLDNISATREKLEIFGTKQITRETKFIFIATTILYIIVIALLTFSKINLYMIIVGTLLIGMVIFVTVLMFDIDNLSHGTYFVKTKNIEELISLMEGKIQTEDDTKQKNRE